MWLQVSGATTKERILDAAEEIMLERSFHSVGLNQILSAVKVPKGSFYHYFKSKEEFGVEMLRHYASGANARKRQMLLTGDLGEDPITRLFAVLESWISNIVQSGGKCPCLMQKLAAEVSNFSDAMREELARGFTETIAIFKEVLDQAVAHGSLPAGFDTASEAAFLMDLWAGAQQRTLIFRDVEPLRRALDVFRCRLTQTT